MEIPGYSKLWICPIQQHSRKTGLCFHPPQANRETPISFLALIQCSDSSFSPIPMDKCGCRCSHHCSHSDHANTSLALIHRQGISTPFLILKSPVWLLPSSPTTESQNCLSWQGPLRVKWFPSTAKATTMSPSATSGLLNPSRDGDSTNCISWRAWSSGSNWNTAFSSLNPTPDSCSSHHPISPLLPAWI